MIVNTSPPRRGDMVWFGGMVVYFLFFMWYNNFQGRLTEEEIDAYMEVMEQRETSSERGLKAIRKFMEEDDGRDFIMVNLLHQRPWHGAAEDEPMGRYLGFMLPELLWRACVPLFSAQAVGPVLDRVGLNPTAADGTEPTGEVAPELDLNQWGSVALFRYRSRRDMMDIATMDGFADAHPYKVEALIKTLAFPVYSWVDPNDPRVLFGLLVLFIVTLITSGMAMQRTQQMEKQLEQTTKSEETT